MARYENGEETRDIILRSALKLIYEKGLDGLTFGELADEAHVSRTSVIYHFKNKANLSAELSYNLFYANMNDISEILQSPRFSYILACYIFWYQFFTDSRYRRWIMSMKDTDDGEKIWLKTMYGVMLDSYGISDSLENFVRRNEFAGILLSGMEMNLCKHINENMDEYQFFDVADREVQLTSRIFGIPDKQISEYLSEGRKLLVLVDFNQFHWNLEAEE